MAEGGVGTFPQVFVVDSQASYVSVPGWKREGWARRMGQKFLLLLVGFTMLGLVVEAYLIYNLYKKIEGYSHCMPHPFCQNLSSARVSGQQVCVGVQWTRVCSNEIPTRWPHPAQVEPRPFAHLIGSRNPVGENNVVQWEHKVGETITYHMGYNNGRLLVEKDGHYYLYSKVTINAAEECKLIQHTVMKVTKAYDAAIELMKSKSFRCRTQKPSTKPAEAEDLLNSFLAGIFHLQSGDEIFVGLEDIHTMRTGPTDNLMGAFMIAP
uniref:THD domain-containing protein n=1 Tax=Mola mola TaxID=94237 RepID=A0A3Q4C0C4_MOLML